METMQKLIEQYVPLANKLAASKKKSLPRFIDFEEVQSAAYLGLVEAASRFNPAMGTAFSTFAYPRIQGAIQDHLRFLGALKTTQVETEDGTSFIETVAAKQQDNFEEIIEEVSRDLGKDAQDMLRSYILEDETMKEIGCRYNVTESRVCQLFSSYKKRIKERWNNPAEILAA